MIYYQRPGSVVAYYQQVGGVPDARSNVPTAPNAGFSAGAAMGSNKLIDVLADYALVVASEAEKGGTWGGATEALKHGWVPVFVLEGPDMPEGNRQLLQKGALAFPEASASLSVELGRWLKEHSVTHTPPPMQPKLL